ELAAFPELLVVLDKRGLRDAIGGLLLQRLYQDGKAESLRARNAFAARDGDELRHADAMVAQDFFGDSLVLAERQPGRTAPGEGHPVHFEERNDVLVEGAVVLELVGQVENDVRPEALELLSQQIEVVEDR